MRSCGFWSVQDPKQIYLSKRFAQIYRAQYDAAVLVYLRVGVPPRHANRCIFVYNICPISISDKFLIDLWHD